MQNLNYEPPVPLSIPRRSIESYADSISAKFGLTKFVSEDDPVVSFTLNLGGQIGYEPEDDIVRHEDGSIVVHGPQKFDIYLSNYTGPLRDRFTLAHELGHYFLHSDQGKKRIKASRRGSSLSEWEANWFAAALLMPSEEVKSVWKGFLIPSAELLASHFRVSVQAAQYRVDRLQLLAT